MGLGLIYTNRLIIKCRDRLRELFGLSPSLSEFVSFILIIIIIIIFKKIIIIIIIIITFFLYRTNSTIQFSNAPYN